MALFFTLAGLILIFTGVNGTVGELGKLLKGDFTGPNNFIVWIAAIIIAGLFGYAPRFKPISYAFLALIFVAILLSSGSGFFDKFNQTIKDMSK